jgi:hypothetical protein
LVLKEGSVFTIHCTWEIVSVMPYLIVIVKDNLQYCTSEHFYKT